MTQEQIRERLKNCHVAENACNKQMGQINYEIKQLKKKKKKLATQVSKNMRYRNSLIAKLER